MLTFAMELVISNFAKDVIKILQNVIREQGYLFMLMIIFMI